MLGLDQLVPEIMLGIGMAVFVGSLLAWLRGSRPRPSFYLMRNPSARPRSTESPGANSGVGGERRHMAVNRTRTLFFMIAGFVTAVWSLLSLLDKSS